MTGMRKSKDASKGFDSIVGAYAKKYASYVLENNLPEGSETTIDFLMETSDGQKFQNELASLGIDLSSRLKDILDRFVYELKDAQIKDMLHDEVARDPSVEAYADGNKLLRPGKTGKGYAVGIISKDKDDEGS